MESYFSFSVFPVPHLSRINQWLGVVYCWKPRKKDKIFHKFFQNNLWNEAIEVRIFKKSNAITFPKLQNQESFVANAKKCATLKLNTKEVHYTHFQYPISMSILSLYIWNLKEERLSTSFHNDKIKESLNFKTSLELTRKFDNNFYCFFLVLFTIKIYLTIHFFHFCNCNILKEKKVW